LPLNQTAVMGLEAVTLAEIVEATGWQSTRCGVSSAFWVTTLGALHQGDNVCLLVGVRFGCSLPHPGAPTGLGRSSSFSPCRARQVPPVAHKSGDRRATASQIRLTAALRLVNFFTGFSFRATRY
jgi:hypothetical protein